MCNHDPNREAAMVVIERNDQGVPTVWCDPCIEPLIRTLNTGGFRTAASCCGHGTHPTWVGLADGRIMLVTEFSTEKIEAVYTAMGLTGRAGGEA